MTSASSVLHQHCSSPAVEGCVEATGRCWLCAGAALRGKRVEEWQGALFTGQNKVRCPTAEWVCEACVWVCARSSPVPGRPAKDGKQPPNFRNFSHLYDAGTYLTASKGEKPAILEFLKRPKAGPWFAAVADSGQKHVVPWAPVNPPGTKVGRVLFEEQLVRLPDAGGWGLVADIAALLTAGATKEEVGSGDYTSWAWMRCPREIGVFEAAHRGERHGAWWTLALWLAQRDEEAVAERVEREKAVNAEKAKERRRGREAGKERAVARADGGAGAAAPGAVPRRKRGEPAAALGPAPGQVARGSEAVRDGGGGGDGPLPEAPARGAEQLALALD
jgi:hypothetical protein